MGVVGFRVELYIDLANSDLLEGAPPGDNNTLLGVAGIKYI